MALGDYIRKLFSFNFKNTLSKKSEEKLATYVKDKIEQIAEDQYVRLLNLRVFNDVNTQLKDYIRFDYSQYTQERLIRYSEYELIQQKIPEQENQVSLMYDLVINPETYSTEFIDFDIKSDDQMREISVPGEKTEDGLMEKVTVNLQEYLNIYCRQNNIYPMLKQQIHNALFYGDGFIEISNLNGTEENKLQLDDYVTRYLTYSNISPKQVLILQIESIRIGYLILPDDTTKNLLNEKKLTLDFLTMLLKELDTEKFKVFTKYQIFQESYNISNFNHLMQLKLDNYDSEQPEIELNNENLEKIRSLLESNVEFKKDFQRMIQEQVTTSQSSTTQFTFAYQIDLSNYFGRSGTTGVNDKKLEELMAIDPLYGNLIKNSYVRLVLNNNMQHFTLTNYKYYPYGQGLLDSVRSIQSLILLLEYQMIIYRLTKAPDRKKYIVDVTGIQKEKIPEYINRIKNELKSQKSIDLNGTIQENLDLVTLMEDYFILRKNGADLLNIENVEGQEMQSWYDDMKYWHDKLLSSLKIPPSYLGFSENLSGQQTVLAIQDHRVQRQIIHLQNDLNDGIQSLFQNSMSILKNIKNSRRTFMVDELLDYMINQHRIICKLFQPTSLEQQEKQKTISDRLTLIKDINQITGYNIEDLLNYFKIFTSTEIQSFNLKKEVEDQELKKDT